MLEDNHIFQGLKRDNHQIRQDKKFLWDAHNIRLTNRKDSTLFSITNEKGTLDTEVTFQGYYVGHCVLGKYLVVFTCLDDNTDCIIYRVERLEDGTYKKIILYREDSIWDYNHPLETLGIYETELVQKVYWVDGVHQPRVINIAKPELKIDKKYLVNGVDLSTPDNNQGLEIENPKDENDTIVNYLNSNGFSKGLYLKGSLDFIQDLELKEKVEIYRTEGEGMFSPGVIQYAFSYHNKYEQETNIFYVTPLQYISPANRGGNPEEKVSNSFNIEIYDAIKGTPELFEFIRIYSIHRTSIDAVPTVKVVGDISTKRGKGREFDTGDPLVFVDDGTKGYTIDPTQLLYIGGRSIIAGTITSKDNTLFLGNLDLTETNKDFKSNFDTLKEELNEELNQKLNGEEVTYDRINDWELSSVPVPVIKDTYYGYINPLPLGNIAGFKSRETYRCGIQIQTKDGVWSEPIYLADTVLCDKAPFDNRRYSKAIRIKASEVEALLNKGAVNIRSCIVFPRTFERDILCQGILCPTVFSVQGRNTNSFYSASSWFFRPSLVTGELNNESNILKGSNIQFQHNKPLLAGNKRGAEIQNMIKNDAITSVENITDPVSYNNYFFIDENIVTFHSPDIEFDTNLQNLDWTDCKLEIIGMARLGAISGDIDIQTSSPAPIALTNPSKGFVHSQIGYTTNSNVNINGGLVSGLFYNSNVINTDYSITDKEPPYFMVYPWSRSGSLNNDSNRPDTKGTKTAVLSKKTISNLKFFSNNSNLETEQGDSTEFIYNISTPQLFNSNELKITKIDLPYLDKKVIYMGNVDTLLTSNQKYPIYYGNGFSTADITALGSEYIKETNDPVRMKYKSTPHLVFSLQGNSNTEIPILPAHAGINSTGNNSSFTIPNWSSNDGTNNDPILNSSGNITKVNSSWLNTREHIGQYRVNAAGDLDLEDPKNYFFVGQAVLDSTGRAVMKWNGHNGKILKLINNINIYTGSPIPDGIDLNDFGSGYVYLGEEKYYKVKFKQKDPSSSDDIYELELLNPASINESPVASEPIVYNITQSIFGRQERVSPYLLLAQIVRNNNPSVKFGGNSRQSLLQNMWFPASNPINIENRDNQEHLLDIDVPFEYGDTWYSRYDCLKTYPFTKEDENQIVEIGSFMVETRVNIDGRYDKNRGQKSNLTMSPQNFNLINEVYSQKDNFFDYRILDEDYYKQNNFANQITWSKEKHYGEDVDTWSNISLANTLDMDGTKGKITALKCFNEHVLCFQEKAISNILFNSRVQIPVSDGVPVEISNGYKVDGSRFISDSIGCQNKWSIINTDNGIYFIDNNTSTLYLFNGQLNNISDSLGMKWWFQDNNTDKVWKPFAYEIGDNNGIRSFYDPIYKDIYFTPGRNYYYDRYALCYSEQLSQFISQMSYGGTQAMFFFDNGFYSLRNNGSPQGEDDTLKLYQNFEGEYNNFFGNSMGWNLSFISNDNPTYTKIFDTIELRADFWNKNRFGVFSLSNTFDMTDITVDNEYQEAKVPFDKINMRKKFRVWRGLIPRNSNTRARIRNPWTMITLGWTPKGGETTSYNNRKAVIHDISVKYTI